MNQWLRSRKLALIAISILLISGLPATSDALTLALEQTYPRILPNDCPNAQAIVVLGGIAKQIGGQTEFNESVDRFEAGITLYKAGKAPTLIFTGAQTPGQPCNEGNLLQAAAIAHGIPPEAIKVTSSVVNTESEANAIQADLAQHGAGRIILVTSAMHMPRAALLFRRAGIDFIPYPTDYHSDFEWKFEKFVPSAEALSRTEAALRELYANLLYRLRG